MFRHARLILQNHSSMIVYRVSESRSKGQVVELQYSFLFENNTNQYEIFIILHSFESSYFGFTIDFCLDCSHIGLHYSQIEMI